MGETSTDVFNIRRWVESRCNFTHFLNSISSMLENIVVISDDDVQQYDGDRRAIKHPVVPQPTFDVSPMGVLVGLCFTKLLQVGGLTLEMIMVLLSLFLPRVCEVILACLSAPTQKSLLAMHFHLMSSPIWRPWVAPH